MRLTGIGAACGRGIRHCRRRRRAERRRDDPRRSPDPLACAETGADHRWPSSSISRSVSSSPPPSASGWSAALNLISVAFAVLFVGLGVDFGIQFSVRYRAERLVDRDLDAALRDDRARRRGTASARRRLDRGRVLFLPADRLRRPLRARADRRNRHDRRVRDHRDSAACAAYAC